MFTGQIGVYLLEVSVLLILLYIFNKLLLGRETLHRLNRALWLSVVAVAFVAPLLSHMSFDVPYTTVELVVQSDEIFNFEGPVVAESAHAMSAVEHVVNIIFWLYLLGLAVIVAQRVMVYASLLALVLNRRYNIWSTDREFRSVVRALEQQMGITSRIRYVVHERELAPFSWFGFVVISRADFASNGREIILHELAHVKQRHTVDVLLMDLVTIILWFNPAAWLTKRSLQQVHEYCADDAVLAVGVNIKEYQLLLIKKAVGARLYSISNSLNHSNLKSRITMMLQKKSNKMAAVKSLYAIPLVALAMILFSSPALADSTSAISQVKITNYFVDNQIDSPENIYDGGKTDDISVVRYASAEPYIVVNGEWEPDMDMHSIDAEKIEKIEVIKGSDSYAKYHIEGDRSQGLIIITLKDGETAESARLTAEQIKERAELREQRLSQESEAEQTPFLMCEKMPSFQGGGLPEFRAYVMQRLKYPKEAQDEKIQGRVLVKFIIDTDGSLIDIEPFQGPNAILFAEVKRVLSTSPKWEPGELRGKKVKVMFTLPVDFAIPSSTE